MYFLMQMFKSFFGYMLSDGLAGHRQVRAHFCASQSCLHVLPHWVPFTLLAHQHLVGWNIFLPWINERFEIVLPCSLNMFSCVYWHINFPGLWVISSVSQPIFLCNINVQEFCLCFEYDSLAVINYTAIYTCGMACL